MSAFWWMDSLTKPICITFFYLILFFWLRNYFFDSMGSWFVSFLLPVSLASKVLWMWNISECQSQGLWRAASSVSPRVKTLLLLITKNKRWNLYNISQGLRGNLYETGTEGCTGHWMTLRQRELYIIHLHRICAPYLQVFIQVILVY